MPSSTRGGLKPSVPPRGNGDFTRGEAPTGFGEPAEVTGSGAGDNRRKKPGFASRRYRSRITGKWIKSRRAGRAWRVIPEARRLAGRRDDAGRLPASPGGVCGARFGCSRSWRSPRSFTPTTPPHTRTHFNGLGNSHTPAYTRNSWLLLSVCPVARNGTAEISSVGWEGRRKRNWGGGGQGAPEVATAEQVFLAVSRLTHLPHPLSFSPFAHPKPRHARGSSCLESPNGCTRGRDQLPAPTRVPDNSWEETWRGVQGEETALFQMFNAATGKLTP